MTFPELRKQIDAMPADIEALRQFWIGLMPDVVPYPDEKQLRVWLSLSGSLDVVLRAIRRTAQKNIQVGFAMELDHAVRFASRLMNDDPASANYRGCRYHEYERTAQITGEMQ